MVAAFIAFKIGFVDPVTSLMTTFTTDAGAVFGAKLGGGVGVKT